VYQHSILVLANSNEYTRKKIKEQFLITVTHLRLNLQVQPKITSGVTQTTFQHDRTLTHPSTATNRLHMRAAGTQQVTTCTGAREYIDYSSALYARLAFRRLDIGGLYIGSRYYHVKRIHAGKDINY
jgi:hypothetical protein